MQLKSLMVTSNASNPQWLLASKFANRCSALQCLSRLLLGAVGPLTLWALAHLRQGP